MPLPDHSPKAPGRVARWASGIADPIGRVLAASLFLGSGYDHVANWDKSLAVVTARGLLAPSLMLGAAVVTELVGAVCLVLGWHTRLCALVLVGFSLVATGLFHADFAIDAEFHMFAKDVALAGALLCLAARSPGVFSLDGRSRTQRP